MKIEDIQSHYHIRVLQKLTGCIRQVQIVLTGEVEQVAHVDHRQRQGLCKANEPINGFRSLPKIVGNDYRAVSGQK